MTHFLIIFLTIFTSGLLFCKPNVILILVDDMGYSDPGYMGGESETPNLEKLSTDGITFLNCFNNAKCAPSRASLMTGMSCQRVKAFKSAGNIETNHATTIAEILASEGYTTILSGKWHINPSPLDIGFQFHYGAKLTPMYFKRDVLGVPGGKRPGPLTLEGEEVSANSLPDDWYGTTAYTDYAIEKIDKEAISQGKPFFVYLALNAPHFPLSAPKEVVDKYEGIFDLGTDKIRLQRYQRMIQRGILDPDSIDLPEMNKDLEGNIPQWDSFNNKEQRLFKRKLQLIAGMVDVIDQEVGKLVHFLKQKNQFENTLFIFLSDNGASAESGIYGGCPLDTMTDEDIDKLGTREGILVNNNSGTIVANVQNTPYRGNKTSLWEGGMKTSMIVHWPEKISFEAAKSYNRTPVSIYDLAPTIYDATGVSYPSQIHGRKLNHMDGVSIIPLLESVELKNRNLRFAYKRDQVIRNKEFKLYGNRGKKSTLWQLFDLRNDESEIKDVFSENPEIAESMINDWRDFDSKYEIVSGYDQFFSSNSKKKKSKN